MGHIKDVQKQNSIYNWKEWFCCQIIENSYSGNFNWPLIVFVVIAYIGI